MSPDWLAIQLALAGQGAQAIGGAIVLDDQEAATLPPAVLQARAAQRTGTDEPRPRPGGMVAGRRSRSCPRPSGHHQFSGASLAVTARTYRAVGGLPIGEALEDEALERALEDGGIPIRAAGRCR